ncbi:hypothetical protein GRI44_04610 [Altererythrobacter confluentis]|uniref:Uncharacterized protein n=1 Tax=Allopontixanthobacter confluentis TaxID=1849021 RepID=A0A6L7GGG1_9SPHN|nr:hypothetical protein [Allopontixanthobacter confluentis]MXP14028.1 hypothetical protein [Allopontixanthobacter confluentis]
MSGSRSKPQGKSGPFGGGPNGPTWFVIPFPEDKAERERLIANLFAKAFDRWVATETDPTLAPFGQPKQNEENDLDFTIDTSAGPMQMELAEFAPLSVFGPRFTDAPTSLQPHEKAEHAIELIGMKSAHQGAVGRFLVIYSTEHGFWLDPITIERMRRAFQESPPRFDRVYWISIHSLTEASVSEIYPGKPHHFFGDADLDAGRIFIPHPADLRVVTSVEWQGSVGWGMLRIPAKITLNYDGASTIGEIRMTDPFGAVVGEQDEPTK